MSIPLFPRRVWPAALATALLACACGEPPDDSPQQQMEERLVGTWLREYQEDTVRVRRVLVLEPDGSFQEMATVAAADSPVTEHSHAGAWHFDGTNLKRRYTRMNGRQPSAPTVPFATFELRFQHPDEFIGIDNVRKRQVRYRRVVEGTRP
jgi:hypothetical protein